MDITTRADLGKLFEAHRVTGRGAEIGVQQGVNARNILADYKGMMHLVDNWNPKWDGTRNLAICMANLNRKPVKYLVMDSVESANHVEDESLDFVYIDGDHSYQGIKADWEAWYPKVRPGGIIAGHDYGAYNDCQGVKKYIDELIANGVQFQFTTDDFWNGMEYQSFWTFKPEL